jgi:hypothetical protein
MIHQIQIKNQVPAILKGSKIKMLPFTHTRKIGDTVYVVSTGYSDGANEDALAKMKRVILFADVTREQECAMLDMHTPDCLAEQRKETEE